MLLYCEILTVNSLKIFYNILEICTSFIWE